MKLMNKINSNYPSKRGLIPYFFDTQHNGKTTTMSRIITILNNMILFAFNLTLPPLPRQFIDKKKGRGFLHLPCAKFQVSQTRTKFIMLLKKHYSKFFNKNKQEQIKNETIKQNYQF